MKLSNTTWIHCGSTYIINKDSTMYTLVKIVQVEPIVTLAKKEMLQFLKNFKCINRG